MEHELISLEKRKREHLKALLVELAELGHTLPPGEYNVDDLLRKIAIAKARKAAITCGPTERLRGQ